MTAGALAGVEGGPLQGVDGRLVDRFLDGVGGTIANVLARVEGAELELEAGISGAVLAGVDGWLLAGITDADEECSCNGGGSRSGFKRYVRSSSALSVP